MVALGGEHGAGSSAFYQPRNTEIGNGATALHAAVENGHLEAVRVLLNAGARQLTSMQGASPLLISLQYRHPAIALYLLQESNLDKVHANAQTAHDGSFPLLVAAMHGYKRVVERLLDIGVMTNMTNRRGDSALSAAVHRGHVGVAQLLLDKSSTSVLKNSILAAAESGKSRLLVFLLQRYNNHVDTIRTRMVSHHCLLRCDAVLPMPQKS